MCCVPPPAPSTYQKALLEPLPAFHPGPQGGHQGGWQGGQGEKGLGDIGREVLWPTSSGKLCECPARGEAGRGWLHPELGVTWGQVGLMLAGVWGQYPGTWPYCEASGEEDEGKEEWKGDQKHFTGLF